MLAKIRDRAQIGHPCLGGSSANESLPQTLIHVLARLPFQGKGQRGIGSRYDVGGCSVRNAAAFSDRGSDEPARFLIGNLAWGSEKAGLGRG
jgi:hypothetical protein